MPVCEDPETCADAVAAALHRLVPNLPASVMRCADGSARYLDEAEAYQRLRDVPVADWLAMDVTAPLPDLSFPYPVVAKVLDVAILHKSDAGGVVIGIDGPDALAQAVTEICENVPRELDGRQVTRVLVQQMRKGVGEVLIGMRHDPDVGPIVVLAAGGVFTEIYRDAVMRLAPVDLDTARHMVDSLKLTQILDGARGHPKGDLEALAQAVVAVSKFALDHDIIEAEINPVIVLPRGHGVVAVDALISTRAG